MEMIWDQGKGYGYYPVDTVDWPYDESYFHKYQAYEHTAVGLRLNSFRTNLALQIPGTKCDVGIGSGYFVKNFPQEMFGFDVNPYGVEWLKENNCWANPYEKEHDLLTFWDSFEHIPNHTRLLKMTKRCLISLPIFRDHKHALSSKHFRKDEHYWYFTSFGIDRYMELHGFKLLAEYDTESKLGREGILTFDFAK